MPDARSHRIDPEQRGERLEEELRALAAHVTLPEGRGIASIVAHRLAAASLERTGRSRRRPWHRRGATGGSLVLALVGVVLLTGVVVGVGLGLAGLRLTFVDQLPGVPSVPAGTETGAALGIGDRTTLDEARREAGFPVLVPSAAGLELPDGVYLIRREPSNVVSLLYAARAGLPAVGPSDVGLLLMEFQGGIDENYMKSLLDGGVVVRRVEVNGELGFWVEGQHVLQYVGPDRRNHDEPPRLVGNVLVWQRGTVLLRLETGGSMEDALKIAESVR